MGDQSFRWISSCAPPWGTRADFGFCLFGDGAIAIRKYLAIHSEGNVLIVDLDAHHGDGNAEIFANETRVKIFDMYNKDAFPIPWLAEKGLKRPVAFEFPLKAGTDGRKYLQILKKNLPLALASQKFDLIYYIAGVDPYTGDELGGLKVSENSLIARDEFCVVKSALEAGIPIFMALAGGYSKEMPQIVYRSVANMKAKRLILSDSIKKNDVEVDE